MISNNHPGTQIIYKLGLVSGTAGSTGPFLASNSQGSLFVFNRDASMGEGPSREETLTLFWPTPGNPNDAGNDGGARILFKSFDPLGNEQDQANIKARFFNFGAETAETELTIGANTTDVNVRFHTNMTRFNGGAGFYGLNSNPDVPNVIIISDRQWDPTNQYVGSVGEAYGIEWRYHYSDGLQGSFGRIECVSLGDNLEPTGSAISISPYNSVFAQLSWSFNGMSGTLEFPSNGGGNPVLSSSATTLIVSGSLEITGTGESLVLRAPNNSRWRVTVDNSGTISTTSI